MEAVAYFSHKYVMHGFGWFLHESHHSPREGFFELNDLYAAIFAIPSIRADLLRHQRLSPGRYGQVLASPATV